MVVDVTVVAVAVAMAGMVVVAEGSTVGVAHPSEHCVEDLSGE